MKIGHFIWQFLFDCCSRIGNEGRNSVSINFPEIAKDTEYLIWALSLLCVSDKLTNMKAFHENYCMYQSFKLFI